MARLLLDTRIALWAISGDKIMGGALRRRLRDPDDEMWVSMASLWEIGIKRSIDRSAMPIGSMQAADYFERAGYRFIGIERAHINAVELLPFHHRDPFDRMLVAQAMTEPFVLLTRDGVLANYGAFVELV